MNLFVFNQLFATLRKILSCVILNREIFTKFFKDIKSKQEDNRKTDLNSLWTFSLEYAKYYNEFELRILLNQNLTNNEDQIKNTYLQNMYVSFLHQKGESVTQAEISNILKELF